MKLETHVGELNTACIMWLQSTFFSDQWQCLEVLLEAGANLNTSDCHFGTPLHITANQGFIRCGEILLRAGMEGQYNS